MAKKSTEAQYQAWLKDVESKLSDESQKQAFRTLTDSEAGKELFGGHLREADYYQRLNDYNEEKRELEKAQREFEQKQTALYGWYEEQAPKNDRLIKQTETLTRQLAAYKAKLAEEGLEDVEGVERMTAAVQDVAKREDVEKIQKDIDQRMKMLDRALPNVLADVTDITYRIIKEGYKVNPKDVFEYSMKNGVALPLAFDALTKDERSAKEAKAREDEIAKAREEGRREALSKFPTPDLLRGSGPSLVERLNNAPADRQSRVDSAVAEYLATAGSN